MIEIPKFAGICRGITNTLSLVYEIYEREIQKENPKKIYIYNNLINNQKVIKELEELGIEIIDNLKVVTDEDIVILGCNSSNEEVYSYLDVNNIEYYDGCCSKIAKIKKEIAEKYQDGFEIIFVASLNDKELEGLNSYCQNKGIIISNHLDVKKIESNKNKFVVIFNSLPKEEREQIINKLEEKYGNKILTIEYCHYQDKLLESSYQTASNSKVMFVVGEEDKETDDLYNKLSLTTKCYKFTNLNDFAKFIMSSDFKLEDNLGLTGSFNTPLKEIYNYKYLLSFLLFYKEKLQEFKQGQALFNQKLLKNQDNDIVQKIVSDFMDLNSDGKYIRATLIALGAYLANEKETDYLDLCYAYETFQTAVLVHDDIIDNAKMRRGKETIPRRICREYLSLSNVKDYHTDVLKLANSVAICIGDLGFYEASNYLVQKYHDRKNFGELFTYYNDIIIKTIKGEMIDVTLPFLGKYDLRNVNEQDILDIYHNKTSWYTVIGPFILGYILGGKIEEENLVKVLNKIGLAFQIKDDILGIYANAEVIGKPNTSDISEFKQTIMYSYIMNTAYKNDFLKIYGNSYVSSKDLEEIRHLYRISGAYKYAQNYLDSLYGECLEEIDMLSFNDLGKDILKGLVIYINIRDK